MSAKGGRVGVSRGRMGTCQSRERGEVSAEGWRRGDSRVIGARCPPMEGGGASADGGREGRCQPNEAGEVSAEQGLLGAGLRVAHPSLLEPIDLILQFSGRESVRILFFQL